MKVISSSICKFFIFFIVMVFAVISAIYTPMSAINAAGRVLVVGVGLLAAGIFPSIIFIVNAVHIGERDIRTVNLLYRGLKDILKLLIGMLCVSMTLILVISLATILVYLPPCPPIDIAIKVIIFITISGIAILILQLSRVFNVFAILLDLNYQKALHTAKKTNNELFSDIKKNTHAPTSDYGDNPKPLKPLHG